MEKTTTVVQALETARERVQKGDPLVIAITNPDEDLWFQAARLFVLSMPEMTEQRVGEWLAGAPQEEVIATLDRAIKRARSQNA